MASDSLHKQREEAHADAAAEDQRAAVNGDASSGSSTPLSSSASHSRSMSAASPFLTPTKSSSLPSSSSSAVNGHSSPASSLTGGRPPVARPALVKLVQPMSIAIGRDWDPLLHPRQQKNGKGAVDEEASLLSSGRSGGSGGAASPAPRDGSGGGATPRAPTLSASVSSSELSSLASSVPSPSSSAPTPSLLSAAPPAPMPLSLASPSSAAFSAPSPLPSSSSSSSLSSWLSSFSSSSSSRDVALISTPPPLFPDYIAELSALLYTLTVFPLPSPPPVIAQLQEAMAASPLVPATPPASAVSAALSDLDARRKQLHQYNGSSVKKRQARLQRLVLLHEAYVVELKHLIVRARKKCDAGYEGLSAIVERLRSCFLMNEFNLLQEGMHLQDELYDNYEDMCKACILALRDRTAELQTVLDALHSASPAAAPALSEHHFLSSKQVCLLVPSLLSMLQRAQDLSQRLSQVKVEYVQVSKVTEEEEKVGRHDRIIRVIDDFYASYNGDLTADYSPARSLEYEFSRFCLDERSKEGQRLKRWMDGIQQQAEQQSKERGGAVPSSAGKQRLTHHSILVFMRKFESNFAKEYGVAARHRLYLRLLIQRMLFPRIWTVCCLLEDADGESKAQDEQFVSQADWLRCLRLEQLGVTAPFLMPDSIKQQVMEKISAGSSRWSKAREGQRAKAEAEDGVGGGKLPTELPTALKALLHLAEERTEGRETGDAAAGQGKAEDADEFDRLFTKGAGGAGGGGQSAAASGSRDLFDKSDRIEHSPSVSPSPSFSSPLAASTSSSLSLSASAPLAASFTPPPPLSLLPVSPAASTVTSSAQPASHASSHSSSTSSSSSSASAPSAPLPARIAALKSRSSPLPARLRPYLSCIECMEDISHLTSPLDMLQCLLAVARNIYKSATEYSTLNAAAAGGGDSKRAELGADSFFPIWLFVLIHSDVRDLHRRVRMMKEYGLVKTQELAEHEYYLTCMEGGLLFVRQADPDNY